MASIDLTDMLKEKSLVEKAIWYRVFKSFDIVKLFKNKDWKQLIERTCSEYLLDVDRNFLSWLEKNYSKMSDDELKRLKESWNKELENLKKKIIEEKILLEIKKANYLSDLETEKLLTFAQSLGALLAADLKTAQIRRFLGAVMEMETKMKCEKNLEGIDWHQVAYLKVYLAYAAGRNKAVLPLLKVVEPMIDRIHPRGCDGWEDFQKLTRFVRSVVAYHKFYGGAETGGGKS